MKTVCLIEETPEFQRVLKETYQDLLITMNRAKLSYTNQRLVNEDELFKLHDLVALMYLGHINIAWSESSEGRVLSLEFEEKGALCS